MPVDQLLRQGVSKPHHAMLTLESLLRPHNTLTNAVHCWCILSVSATMDLFGWNKLSKLRDARTEVKHGKVLGNRNGKTFVSAHLQLSCVT